MDQARVEKVDILGVGVSAIDMPMALSILDGWITENSNGNGRCRYVCIRDVHGVMASQHNADLRQIHKDAGLVTPDGMPLVWLSRLRGYSQVRRVCGPDLMLEVCAQSRAKGYRHFFYGGAEGVAERLAARLCDRYPGLTVAGSYCPPFRPLTEAEEGEVIDLINDAAPDIVWVGLSTPKQEYWMARQAQHLKAATLIGVGAAFDFHAGITKRAPRWMQRNGLEWFYRLLSEPRRLWRRYLILAPKFLWLLALEGLGLRRRQA